MISFVDQADKGEAMEYKTIGIDGDCKDYSKSIKIQLFALTLSALAFNSVPPNGISNFQCHISSAAIVCSQ